MHPDLLIDMARQRGLELQASGARHRAARTGRPGVRARLGRRLVRWGHRLAPAPAFGGASTTRRRPATMGP